MTIVSGTGTSGAALSSCTGTLRSGVTTFSGCKIDRVGSSYRLRATDGTLTWNHGPKRGQPIGIAEFARRKAAMHAEGRYSQLNDLAK